jgi:hypothetical protein
MIIVDTSIWVNALRSGESAESLEVDNLLATSQVAMVGIVIAEVLQGARNPSEWDRLRLWFQAIPFLPETRETWSETGRAAFELRQRGTPLPLQDVLIATLAREYSCSVYTSDHHFQAIPGIQLYSPGE